MKVSFYIINDPTPLSFPRELFRICHKIYRAYQEAVVICQDEEQSQLLNEALWTLESDSFLPHEMVEPESGPKTKAPILLSVIPLSFHQAVLINCSDRFLPQVDRYQEIIEIVPPDESKKALARARYKQYQHPDRQAELNCYFIYTQNA